MMEYFSPNYLVVASFIFLHFIVLGLFFQTLLKRIGILPLVVLIIWRLLVTNYYWYYTLTDNADTKRFYLETTYLSGGWLDAFGTGTQFILFLLYPMVNELEWSYYTCFYPFEFAGFIAVILLLDHLHKYSVEIPRILNVNAFLLIAMLPTFNFFTTAIGKDSLVLLGIVLVLTSLKSISSSWIKIVLGVFVVGFIRPHILFLILIALGVAVLVRSNSVSNWRKVVLFSGGILVSMLFLPGLLERLAVQELTSEALLSRVELQNTYNQHSGTTINIPIYNIPLRLFTFYFRPFFFDINGFLSIVASMENLLWLYMFLKTFSLSFIKRAKLGSFLLSFHFMFFLLGGIIMAIGVNNIGLALRQKIMFLPSVLYLFAVWYNNRRSLQ